MFLQQLVVDLESGVAHEKRRQVKKFVQNADCDEAVKRLSGWARNTEEQMVWSGAELDWPGVDNVAQCKAAGQRIIEMRSRGVCRIEEIRGWWIVCVGMESSSLGLGLG